MSIAHYTPNNSPESTKSSTIMITSHTVSSYKTLASLSFDAMAISEANGSVIKLTNNKAHNRNTQLDGSLTLGRRKAQT